MEPEDQEFEVATGDRLKSLRLDRGFTIDQLAQSSRVSRAMISRIERGEASPTAALLARLCEALGLTLSHFFAPDDAKGYPLIRRDEQRLWRDPVTGYLRRSISPPGVASAVDIVEVEFPAGARVSFPPREESRELTQYVWLFEGVLHMVMPDQTHEMKPGDCLFMHIGDAFDFHNPSDKPARYAVILDKGRK